MAENTKEVRKGTFKHVEEELRAYHDTRREIMKLQTGIMSEMEKGSPSILVLMHKQLSHLQNTVDVIETVYSRLTESQRKVINLYYWSNPRTLTWDGVAQQVNCHRATAIRKRDEVIKDISDMLGWR